MRPPSSCAISLTADRASLEAFVDRTTAFGAGLPELDARMDAITSKLAIVDEGTRRRRTSSRSPTIWTAR